LAILWAGLLHDLVTANHTSRSGDSDKAADQCHRRPGHRGNLSIKQLVISHYTIATVKYPIIYSTLRSFQPAINRPSTIEHRVRQAIGEEH